MQSDKILVILPVIRCLPTTAQTVLPILTKINLFLFQSVENSLRLCQAIIGIAQFSLTLLLFSFFDPEQSFKSKFKLLHLSPDPFSMVRISTVSEKSVVSIIS